MGWWHSYHGSGWIMVAMVVMVYCTWPGTEVFVLERQVSVDALTGRQVVCWQAGAAVARLNRDTVDTSSVHM